MALMAVLESDLRSLSGEARRRYPAIKDGAEHAILKLRSLSSPDEIAHNDDILRIFLMACEVKTVKLSVIALSCMQKLLSHDAVAPSALKEILDTLRDHGEMLDESVQLKTLQTILIIFQSRLQPDTEEHMAQALGICLRLLEYNRSSDSVRNTAAATFRQAVALIFDHVVSAESLPTGKYGSGGYISISRSNSVTSDVNRNMNRLESLEQEIISGGSSIMKKTLTNCGNLGLLLLEDLTALAAGGSASWLRISSVQRTFALDILEFILSNYVVVFRTLLPYEQVLHHQICSLLMTSIRTNTELEGEVGEPYFRRLVLRSVAHIIRRYSKSLVTESEVFLSMLVKVISLDMPLWHRILVLEILRNTNVVESTVKALARVVSNVQHQETCDESLAAVAGMFSSKAKGIEWSLDNDASNAAVLVASEAHAITLAIEGLLGVVFTVATLTDEAVDVGELESPRCDSSPYVKGTGKAAFLCMSMVDSTWFTILDALSLILTKSQGEAIILEMLKGYQAFTQACGMLGAIEPLNSFLASLCKFTINISSETERRSILLSPSSKRTESADQRDTVVLTSKNVQALRTLFNIAHRLYNVLGPSWVLVLETLAALDRAIHSPHATTQEVPTSGVKLTRELSSQYSDFNILSSLNSQLFESSGIMHVSAVKSLLSALRQLSYQCMQGIVGGPGQASSQKIGSISFSVERMISILVSNLHRVEPLWDEIVAHFLELTNSTNQHLRNLALHALDQSISAVLGSDEFQKNGSAELRVPSKKIMTLPTELGSLECSVISPLRVLYFSTQNPDVRSGSLKILLHVLERHGEKLYSSWNSILEMLRSVADAPEKELVTLGFQSLRVIMNDGLSTIPADCLHVCIDVTGAYSAQKTELNISLTAIGLLWTSTDLIAKGLVYRPIEDIVLQDEDVHASTELKNNKREDRNIVDHDKLLFSVFSLLHNLGADERPEVRNSAVRTLFQTLGSHGQKLSKSMWEDSLWNYVFPTLDRASHMAATSSKDEWHGKELGTRGGKAVHMLIHNTRNTAQKQWDETIVLVLGGISRLLRSFFPLLRILRNFWSGWQSLLHVVKNSILSGSKEVALAAINCLQSTILSHSPKGNLPLPYLQSVLEVYDSVLQKSANYSGDAAIKAKQEIIHGLGEIYVQAQELFDHDMYTQLLSVIDLAITEANIANQHFEAEFGHVPPMQRTVLEILPQLSPPKHLSPMWFLFLQNFLQYLPRSEPLLDDGEDAEKGNTTAQSPDSTKMPSVSNGTASVPPNRLHDSSRSSASTGSVGVDSSHFLFAEKLIPMLVDLFLQAPAAEKRMTTRRDNPDGALWRVAVEGFNSILIDDVSKLVSRRPELVTHRTARIRMWKEVADVYEIFLVGYCGRALSSESLSVSSLKADELIEMNVLDILGDKILKSELDAPNNILQRLVSTLDRCASRTCSLPVDMVELIPLHCSSFNYEATEWNASRSEVSKISIMILIMRCDYIVKRFLADEIDLGERHLPQARVEETTFVLQELARLVIHTDTSSVLPLHPYLKEGLLEKNNGKRQHLFVLFPSFCDLVVSREARVRELVQVLLRLITGELALEKITLGS